MDFIEEQAEESFKRVKGYSKDLDKDRYIEISLKWIKDLLDQRVKLYQEMESVNDWRLVKEKKLIVMNEELNKELKELVEFKEYKNKNFIQRLFNI